MAIISVTVTVPGGGWSSDDTVELYIGTEGAADLAASTPTGGRRVAQIKVGQAEAGDTLAMTHTHNAIDKCAVLPVGVKIVDAAGNASAVTQTTVQISDPPQGVGRPDISSAASGEITLDWAASPDLE